MGVKDTQHVSGFSNLTCTIKTFFHNRGHKRVVCNDFKLNDTYCSLLGLLGGLADVQEMGGPWHLHVQALAACNDW